MPKSWRYEWQKNQIWNLVGKSIHGWMVDEDMDCIAVFFNIQYIWEYEYVKRASKNKTEREWKWTDNLMDEPIERIYAQTQRISSFFLPFSWYIINYNFVRKFKGRNAISLLLSSQHHQPVCVCVLFDRKWKRFYVVLFHLPSALFCSNSAIYIAKQYHV